MEFNIIPQDLDFWNHALWVIPNPAFVRRFCPLWLEIDCDSYGRYGVYEKIPF